jgi:hypothetical protein
MKRALCPVRILILLERIIFESIGPKGQYLFFREVQNISPVHIEEIESPQNQTPKMPWIELSI